MIKLPYITPHVPMITRKDSRQKLCRLSYCLPIIQTDPDNLAPR